MKNLKDVTIYISSTFGISKIEAKLIDFGTKEYAQYKAAPFIHYIPKGKRKPQGFIQGFNPYMLIIEGHNHINPADAFTEKKMSVSGLMVSSSRMSCFDEGYKNRI